MRALGRSEPTGQVTAESRKLAYAIGPLALLAAVYLKKELSDHRDRYRFAEISNELTDLSQALRWRWALRGLQLPRLPIG